MRADVALKQAQDQVERALDAPAKLPVIRTFFDEATFTATHVVHDPQTLRAAIIDSVMDFDRSGSSMASSTGGNAAAPIPAALPAATMTV